MSFFPKICGNFTFRRFKNSLPRPPIFDKNKIMNNATLEKIRGELAAKIVGRKFGRIFPLARRRLAIDFRLPDGEFLYINIEPTNPRVYLIERRLRELEKQAINSDSFSLFLRKRLANATVEAIEKIDGERVLIFRLAATSEIGAAENYSLVIQLTGRSANIFLLDRDEYVLDALNSTRGAGQEIGDKYAPPPNPNKQNQSETIETAFPKKDFSTLSAALDAHFLQKESETEFRAKVNTARSKIKKRNQTARKINGESGAGFGKSRRRGKLETIRRSDSGKSGDGDSGSG